MFSTLKRKCDLAYYQYEVNTALYMLEPWERKLFNTILVLILLMCTLSTYLFMPPFIERCVKLFQ